MANIQIKEVEMKVVVQRVKSAKIIIDEKEERQIGEGLFLLVGVAEGDDISEADMLAQKCAELRIFDDENGDLNLSAENLQKDILIVSNFTLYANTKKGRRPSFIKAARPPLAVDCYEAFIAAMKKRDIGKVETGEFGAYMEITAVNDGPVTIIIDPAEWAKKEE